MNTDVFVDPLINDVQWPDTPFRFREAVILVGRRGSESHGLYVPPTEPDAIDDRDLMGITIPPARYYLALDKWEHAESIKGPWDVVLYELRKFVRLLCQQNPNVLGILWLEPEDYLLLTDAGRGLVESRDLFRHRRAAFNAFVGYASGQLKRMTSFGEFRGYMGEKRKRLVEKHGFDCYADDTEFLTRRGWQLYDDIVDEDVATCNPRSRTLEWQRPFERVERSWDGPMAFGESRYTSWAVTPNHRMLVSACHRGGAGAAYVEEGASWQFQKAADLINSYRSWSHVLTAVPTGERGCEADADMLRLIGLYLTDGSMGTRDGAPKDVRVYQSEAGKAEVFCFMRRIADRFGFREYHYSRPERTETYVWSSHDSALRESLSSSCGWAATKCLPVWWSRLSAQQAAYILEGMIWGDGTPKYDYADVVYAKPRELADAAQTLALLAGRDSQVYAYDRMHQVYIRRGASRPKAMSFDQRMYDHYTGRVVCFMVPNETLITRRGGKIAVQGNTKNAAHLIRLLNMGEEYLRTGRLNVRRTWDRDNLLAIKRGEVPLAFVQKEAEKGFARCREAFEESPLPTEIDQEAVRDLLMQILGERFITELQPS